MTYADTSNLEKEINFQLTTKLTDVLEKFWNATKSIMKST